MENFKPTTDNRQLGSTAINETGRPRGGSPSAGRWSSIFNFSLRGNRVVTLVRKEFIQIRRDPRLLPILIILPVLQLVIMGYAVSSDIHNLATAICDLDRTPASRAFTDRFETSGYFDIRHRLDD